MDITVRKRGQVQLIHARGPLKLGQSVDELRQAMDELLDSGETRLALNLSEVPVIDSSGIGLLVRELTSAKQRGGTVKLVAPSNFVSKTLKLVGVLNLFEVLDDDETAVQSD